MCHRCAPDYRSPFCVDYEPPVPVNTWSPSTYSTGGSNPDDPWGFYMDRPNPNYIPPSRRRDR